MQSTEQHQHYIWLHSESNHFMSLLYWPIARYINNRAFSDFLHDNIQSLVKVNLTVFKVYVGQFDPTHSYVHQPDHVQTFCGSIWPCVESCVSQSNCIHNLCTCRSIWPYSKSCVSHFECVHSLCRLIWPCARVVCKSIWLCSQFKYFSRSI